MRKNNFNAFTLIELMVVIAIVAMLILGSNFLSFNKVSNKQKLETKIIRINSHFEEIRNNALLWKWIWTNLFVPKKYKIEFSTTWSWVIKNTYLSWSNYIDYNLFNKKIDFSDRFESISQINCYKLDDLNNPENTFNSWSIWTWTIILEWLNMTLTWWCDNNEKILEVEIKRKNDTKKIQINTLNWLIEIVK